MQRLVSPELRVYTVSDREALGELVAELRLDKTLAGNLRQLLGYQTVGPGRQARQVAEDWQLLESVRWLRHLESGKLVPVVGSNAIRIFKRYCCPQTLSAMSGSSRKCMRLRGSKMVWRGFYTLPPHIYAEYCPRDFLPLAKQ